MKTNQHLPLVSSIFSDLSLYRNNQIRMYACESKTIKSKFAYAKRNKNMCSMHSSMSFTYSTVQYNNRRIINLISSTIVCRYASLDKNGYTWIQQAWYRTDSTLHRGESLRICDRLHEISALIKHPTTSTTFYMKKFRFSIATKPTIDTTN